MKPDHISIIIPAYNEETNIRLGALDKVARYLQTAKFSWEVIVVNDGSSDETKLLIEEFIRHNKGFHIIHNPHQGKAYTLVSGMFAAKGNIVLFTDLDQATPLHELEKLVPWFSKGFDIVIGSRSNRREGAPLTRLIMSRGFMILRNILLGLGGIDDTQCGFKAFKRDIIRPLIGQLKLYGSRRDATGSMVSAGFDIEMLFVAKNLGFTIKEVPVEWHFVETRRVNPLSDSWQGFMDIIRIRINAWRGYYA